VDNKKEEGIKGVADWGLGLFLHLMDWILSKCFNKWKLRLTHNMLFILGEWLCTLNTDSITVAPKFKGKLMIIANSSSNYERVMIQHKRGRICELYRFKTVQSVDELVPFPSTSIFNHVTENFEGHSSILAQAF
tara:strand:- start:524 stop:925 length:402 start_codon:yes stop_codon:yes gene_type:complete